VKDVTDELLASIATLLEARRERAALMLLYSSVDILGALCAEGGGASRLSFTKWCDAYMRPVTTLGCSATELYSARCGFLHNLSPETLLTAKGAARRFVYVRDLLGGPMLPAESPDPRIVVINPTALWVCFRDGVREFVADVHRGTPVADQVAANLRGVYVTVETR
jgi:hypothetical protein